LQQTNKPQYRSLKNILIIAASFLLLISAGAACTEDKEATQSDLILAQIGTADKDILDQTGEEIVVYAVDIESLGQSLSLATNQEDKIDAATKYIRNRNRIDCILDGIQDAITENTDISCSGVVTVESSARDGLESVSMLSEAIEDTSKNNSEARYILSGYLEIWSTVKKVDRVKESLEQMERSRAIPLFGSLVESIHKFPILFEGNEMVPASDIDELLVQFKNTPEDQKRNMVQSYLKNNNVLD